MSEKTTTIIARSILALVILVFTLFAFFIPQQCDIDAIYLWCRLHPMSVGDVLGLIMFYGGAFLLSGLWTKWFTLWEEEHSTKWNLIIFAILVLGAVLIWNT